MNLKKPGTIFWFFPFQILKKHTYQSEKVWRNFLVIPFSNIKKGYLQILKNLTQFFVHPLFEILKRHTYKSYKPWCKFLLISFWNIRKKHTYKS